MEGLKGKGNSFKAQLQPRDVIMIHLSYNVGQMLLILKEAGQGSSAKPLMLSLCMEGKAGQ